MHKILTVALATLIAAPSAAYACSCLPTSLSRSWHESSDTMKVEVIGQRTSGQFVIYDAIVVEPFSGCTTEGQRIRLRTARSSAACGMHLTVGDDWLVTTDVNKQPDRGVVYDLNLCGYNKPVETLTAADQRFLSSRTVYCPVSGQMSCADGSDPYACFADPCEVADGCKAATRCESNFCGGCNAEFYNEDWAPVCRARPSDMAIE